MKKTSMDKISLLIISLSFIFTISLWDYMPLLDDWQYHTSIAIEIQDRGIITDNLYQTFH